MKLKHLKKYKEKYKHVAKVTKKNAVPSAWANSSVCGEVACANVISISEPVNKF